MVDGDNIMSEKKSRGKYGAGTYTQKGKNYEYRVWVINPYTNLPERKSFSAPTKAKCREKAKAYEAGNSIGETRASVKTLPTLGEWAEEWLPIYKGDVGKDTFVGYKANLKHITSDKIANLKLRDIKPIQVQDFLNRMAENNLSKSVIKCVKFLLNAMYEDAIDNDLCVKNPVRRVKLPENTKAVERREIWTDDEIQTIEKFAKTDFENFGAAMLLILYSGLRTGELLAINLSRDLDENNILHVRGSLTASRTIVSDTKTKKHVGDIPLPEDICELLRSLGRDTLCPKNDGTTVSTSTFHKRYKDFFERMNYWCENNSLLPVRFFTAHSTRHTYQSRLNAAGVDLPTARDILRQSDVVMTAHYTHTDIEQKRKAVNEAFSLKPKSN